MRGLVFVLMIMTGLLLFGCLGAPPAEEVSEEEVTEPVGGEEVTTEEEVVEEEPAPEPGPVDYSGMDYAGLIATGNPVECDVRISSQGMVYTAKMYIVGEEKLRMEWNYAGQESVAIMVDDTTYIKLDEPYGECEWMSMEGSMAEDGETPEAGTSMHATVPDPEGMASTDFDCRAWTYDSSKFEIPSENVCTSEEIAEQMLGEMYIPEEYQ